MNSGGSSLLRNWVEGRFSAAARTRRSGLTVPEIRNESELRRWLPEAESAEQVLALLEERRGNGEVSRHLQVVACYSPVWNARLARFLLEERPAIAPWLLDNPACLSSSEAVGAIAHWCRSQLSLEDHRLTVLEDGLPSPARTHQQEHPVYAIYRRLIARGAIPAKDPLLKAAHRQLKRRPDLRWAREFVLADARTTVEEMEAGLARLEFMDRQQMIILDEDVEELQEALVRRLPAGGRRREIWRALSHKSPVRAANLLEEREMAEGLEREDLLPFLSSENAEIRLLAIRVSSALATPVPARSAEPSPARGR